MPYQNHRYLPPIATPIVSRYQTDYTQQAVAPPKSYKNRNISNLPPINYSICRQKVGGSLYDDTYKGTFGPAAQTAKPFPYDFPTKERFRTSTYRANFRKTDTVKLPLLPTSPTRRNNPHPMTMNNAFKFPNRGYWIWPHFLNPMNMDYDDESGHTKPSGEAYQRTQGPYNTWEDCD